MKKIQLFLFVIVLLIYIPAFSQVGIGTATPDASAKLDASSITKGFLPPRMTTTQRDAIASPAAGLIIFNTTTNGVEIKTSLGWISLSASSADALPTIEIGTQKWMSKNLDVAFYRNGDVIPQVTDPTAWAALLTGAWCYYNNDSTQGNKYGKLYNWYAVNDPRSLAPQGWHVPSDAEWTILETTLGGSSVAGGG
ncbi:MAG: fibrobacter succinogenes major paralogous domain-containing protein [Chitinophagaceae bacterium]